MCVSKNFPKSQFIYCCLTPKKVKLFCIDCKEYCFIDVKIYNKYILDEVERALLKIQTNRYINNESTKN